MCKANLISSHEKTLASEIESGDWEAPVPTKNCNPIVAIIVTKATNKGNRMILRFFAKSKFSRYSSMNITLKVAANADHPLNGTKRWPPPPLLPRFGV